MRMLLASSPLFAFALAACSGGGGTGTGDTTPTALLAGPVVTVGTDACAVDTDELKGFCLESDTTFSTQGSGECGIVATLWLPPDALSLGDIDLQPDSNATTDGVGAVWIDFNGASYTSTSGTASVTQYANGIVSGSFTAELEDFISGDPGPHASGTVLCERE